MYCSQCAPELTRDDVYCPSCAKPVASFAIDGTPVPQVEPLDREQVTIVRAGPADRSNRSFWLGVASGAMAMLGIGLITILVSGMLTTSRQTAQTNTAIQNAMNSTPLPTPTPTPEPTPTPTPELPVVLPKDPGFFDSKRCSYSNKGQPILVRKDCDVRDCLNDPKTIIGVMPDGGVAIVTDDRRQVPAGRTYSWVPVETEEQGVLWVASNKIVCSQ
jgi:hypothetical protein